MQTLKMPPLDAKTFEANGRTFTRLDSLPIERYEAYERGQIEFAYNATFENMYQAVKGAYLDLNQMKAADASVKLYNILQGITQIEKKEAAACKLCALFIVTEDEDLTRVNEALNSQKIEDWRREGIDMNYFFMLAASFIGGYKAAYKAIFQNTLAATEPEADQAPGL